MMHREIQSPESCAMITFNVFVYGFTSQSPGAGSPSQTENAAAPAASTNATRIPTVATNPRNVFVLCRINANIDYPSCCCFALQLRTPLLRGLAQTRVVKNQLADALIPVDVETEPTQDRFRAFRPRGEICYLLPQREPLLVRPRG